MCALTAPALPVLIALIFCGVTAMSFRAVSRRRRTGELQLAGERARLEEFSASLGRLTAEEDRIRERELSLVTIYEITERMSASMTFEDIFSVFSASLDETLSFSACDLLILKRGSAGGPLELDRRYRVLKEGGGGSAGAKAPDYERLVARFSGDPKELWLSREKDAQALADLGIVDDGVSTFVAIPLLGEKGLVGILAFGNLAKNDFEKAVLLAMQFALEIKKVLLYETVERLSVTDSLTGLYVRRYFFERFREEVERSAIYGLSFAFIMIDIDDFKKCNDTYGHLVGDVVLKDVARIMREHVREIDLVARYGGEEFALVLPETGLEGARHAAERIRATIAEHVFRAYDEKLRITISAGIALYPADADGAADLVERSDKALYRAKRSGKNCVCIYNR